MTAGGGQAGNNGVWGSGRNHLTFRQRVADDGRSGVDEQRVTGQRNAATAKRSKRLLLVGFAIAVGVSQHRDSRSRRGTTSPLHGNVDIALSAHSHVPSGTQFVGKHNSAKTSG